MVLDIGLEPIRCLHQRIFGAECKFCPYKINHYGTQQVLCVYHFRQSSIDNLFRRKAQHICLTRFIAQISSSKVINIISKIQTKVNFLNLLFQRAKLSPQLLNNFLVRYRISFLQKINSIFNLSYFVISFHSNSSFQTL